MFNRTKDGKILYHNDNKNTYKLKKYIEIQPTPDPYPHWL